MAYLNKKYTEFAEFDLNAIGESLYQALGDGIRLTIKLSEAEQELLNNLKQHHRFEIEHPNPSLGYFLMDLIMKEAQKLGNAVVGSWKTVNRAFVLEFVPASSLVAS